MKLRQPYGSASRITDSTISPATRIRNTTMKVPNTCHP
jgi:hypothetical protein